MLAATLDRAVRLSSRRERHSGSPGREAWEGVK